MTREKEIQKLIDEEFTLFKVCNQSKIYNLSKRLEDVIDRALTIIENEDW